MGSGFWVLGWSERKGRDGQAKRERQEDRGKKVLSYEFCYTFERRNVLKQF